MSDMSDLMHCACCGQALERVRHFPRMLMTADDMRAEQEYFREKARRHNRYLHGWGVVCGCTVEAVPGQVRQVRVCPGYFVGPQGDEVCIDRCIDVDLQSGARDQPCSVRWPCPPVGDVPQDNDGRSTVYIAARYAECFSRPVRVHPAGCGCDETGCEYSRVRDSYEVKVLWNLPESHLRARQDDDVWCQAVQSGGAAMRRLHLWPAPPCPECESDPWVVLAAVIFGTGGGETAPPQIRYEVRRVLLATQRLQLGVMCLP
jgi:hypothetical protein